MPRIPKVVGKRMPLQDGLASACLATQGKKRGTPPRLTAMRAGSSGRLRAAWKERT